MTVAALPITLCALVLGYFAVKRENRPLFWTFLGTCSAACAYFVYKLYVIYRDRETDYKLVYKSLTVFGSSSSCPSTSFLPCPFHLFPSHILPSFR